MEIYKNTVLTVIAVSLALIAGSNFAQPAKAQMGMELMRVMICDESGQCAKIDPAFEALQIKSQP